MFYSNDTQKKNIGTTFIVISYVHSQKHTSLATMCSALLKPLEYILLLALVLRHRTRRHVMFLHVETVIRSCCTVSNSLNFLQNKSMQVRPPTHTLPAKYIKTARQLFMNCKCSFQCHDAAVVNIQCNFPKHQHIWSKSKGNVCMQNRLMIQVKGHDRTNVNFSVLLHLSLL